ncbi:protein lifeguard 1-like [Rhagoletis pomonella]|uniref:protein lifeguard 1-like n=1 Tax=Rhagoletis pomonella TaxID=28610 RepID=UPI001784B8DC|nr:protein lifeguard 1-like [Rhagoletis pomonella]
MERTSVKLIFLESYPPGGYAPQPGFVVPPGGGSGYGAYDDPEGQSKNFSFDDISIRKWFIRKVYVILMGQLVVTFGFVALFVFHLPTKYFTYRNPALFWVALVVLLVTMICMACLALALFATQTMCGGVLVVAIVVFLVFGIAAIFIKGKIITLVYASIGALLFSIYLIYDTQLMMGGDHKYSISPEKYIFTALNLYLDIINIFMYILTMIGASRD